MLENIAINFDIFPYYKYNPIKGIPIKNYPNNWIIRHSGTNYVWLRNIIYGPLEKVRLLCIPKIYIMTLDAARNKKIDKLLC